MTSSAEGGVGASAVVAARVKQLRREQGLSADQFVARCSARGGSMTRNILANIETRRRDVSVEHLLLFALVLDVPPTHLLVPVASSDEASASSRPPALAVTDTVTVTDSALVSRWVHGREPLPGTRPDIYLAAARQDSPSESGTQGSLLAAARLTAQFSRDTQDLVDMVRAQVDTLLVRLEAAVTSGSSTGDILAELSQVRQELSVSPRP